MSSPHTLDDEQTELLADAIEQLRAAAELVLDHLAHLDVRADHGAAHTEE